MKPPSPLCRVLLVEDHDLVRGMLHRLLDAAGGFEVVDAANGAEALERVAQRGFDVASIDLSLPDTSGLALIRRLRSGWPGLPLMVLSMDDDEVHALHTFVAGARGYVTKDRADTELAAALRRVAEGGIHVGAGVAGVARRLAVQSDGSLAAAPHAELSARELDVLARLASGDEPDEVAGRLRLDAAAVQRHVARVMARLALPDVAALRRYGRQHGLDATGAAPGPR